MKLKYILIFTLALSCRSKKVKETVALHHPQFMPGPHALVYKTKKDYSNLVPVLLDDSGGILSYPDPADLKTNPEALKPQKLAGGYYLDRKGIGLNVAYLNVTFDDYAALTSAPSQDELKKKILDKSPLTELCDCGNTSGYSDIIRQLNAIIEQDSLKTICKVLK